MRGAGRSIGNLVASALLLLPFIASAAPADPPEDPAKAAYDQCMDQPTGTNYTWSQCGDAYIRGEEARLNETWRQVYRDMDAPTRAALLAEQRAWVIYKDKSCLYYTTGFFGREGQVFHFPNCRAAVIVQRIDYLNRVGDEGEPPPEE